MSTDMFPDGFFRSLIEEIERPVREAATRHQETHAEAWGQVLRFAQESTKEDQ